MLRKGMWVVYEGAVGIYTSARVKNDLTGDMEIRPEFHATDTDGITISIVPNPVLSGLRQATYSEIPAPRRPTPEVGAFLGYV